MVNIEKLHDYNKNSQYDCQVRKANVIAFFTQFSASLDKSVIKLAVTICVIENNASYQRRKN